MMVCVVIGNDTAVTLGGRQLEGNFEAQCDDAGNDA